MITEHTKLKWEPVIIFDLKDWECIAISERVETVLSSWRNTPYMCGQRVKGAGVDCVRFVTGVFDELYGFTRSPIPNIPQDASLHSADVAHKAMRDMLEAYGPYVSIQIGRPVQPGDVVITGPKNGGPGHVIFVGGKPHTMWHANDSRVQQTGMSVIGQKIFRVIRPTNKHLWIR